MAASGTSWDMIIGSIASSIAILIFITGRSSLADLFRKKDKPRKHATQPAPQTPGKLTRLLNKPVFLIIGIISSMLGIYSFTKDLIVFPHTENIPVDTVPQTPPPTNTTALEPPKDSVFKHTTTTTLRTGVLIMTPEKIVDVQATSAIESTIIVYSRGHRPAVRGTITIDKRPAGKTEFTEILSYTVNLQLQFYEPDGINPCNTRTFSEEVIADDQKPVNVIKQQALTAISNSLGEQLGSLLKPCHL